MSARPWMPMYWGDYLADTAHFTNAEHGAYLLLIAFYWTNGKLPDDDEAIRRIAKASTHQWKKIRPVLVEKFSTGWKHKRIDDELAKSLEKSRVNSANAKRRHSERTANAERSDTQSLTHKKEDAPSAPLIAQPAEDAELYARGRAVLGKNSGGLVAKLLKAKNGNIALARAAIEQASTKSDPKEYIGAILRAPNGTAGKIDLSNPDDVMRFALS